MNARDREQFEEFMTSRWPGLVRLFDSTGHVFAISTSVPLPRRAAGRASASSLVTG